MYVGVDPSTHLHFCPSHQPSAFTDCRPIQDASCLFSSFTKSWSLSKRADRHFSVHAVVFPSVFWPPLRGSRNATAFHQGSLTVTHMFLFAVYHDQISSSALTLAPAGTPGFRLGRSVVTAAAKSLPPFKKQVECFSDRFQIRLEVCFSFSNVSHIWRCPVSGCPSPVAGSNRCSGGRNCTAALYNCCSADVFPKWLKHLVKTQQRRVRAPTEVFSG